MNPARAVLPLLLVAVLLGFTGCERIFERLVSDSATRLAYQIRDQSRLLRLTGKSPRTFEHHPAAWPDGPAGDYRIEIISSAPPGDGRRAIFTAKSYDGPLWSSTTYHLNYVQVPRNLKAAHRKGEPTLVTLELRDGVVYLTRLQ